MYEYCEGLKNIMLDVRCTMYEQYTLQYMYIVQYILFLSLF